MKLKLILITSTLLFFVNCSKTTVVLLDSGKAQNAIIVKTNKGSSKLNKIGNFVNLKDKDTPPSKIQVMSQEEIKERFKETFKASPTKPKSYFLYFKPNNELTDKSKDDLQKSIEFIKTQTACTVDIIGHTDSVGSNALNITVSLKRAKSIKKLIEESGAKVLKITAKGYGEEDLLVKTPDETIEIKNRNVEIFIK